MHAKHHLCFHRRKGGWINCKYSDFMYHCEYWELAENLSANSHANSSIWDLFPCIPFLWFQANHLPSYSHKPSHVSMVPGQSLSFYCPRTTVSVSMVSGISKFLWPWASHFSFYESRPIISVWNFLHLRLFFFSLESKVADSEIRTWLIPSTSSPIHYSLIILPFNVI
jgi:hypothetical protein